LLTPEKGERPLSLGKRKHKLLNLERRIPKKKRALLVQTEAETRHPGIAAKRAKMRGRGKLDTAR